MREQTSRGATSRGATSSCNKFEELGLLYFYKELDEGGRIEFEHHLSGCPFCRSALKELEEMTELYESLPEYEPSPDAVRSVLDLSKRLARRFTRLRRINKPDLKSAFSAVLQKLPRPVPALVSRSVWMGSGIGVAIILVLLFRFFPHETPSYLAWDYKIDSEVELIDAGLYELRESVDILGVFSVKERIEGVKEEISTVEKRLQNL